jgi:alginate O-acetyltransferase complex protein AlgI
MSYWFVVFVLSFFVLYWSFPVFEIRRILILVFSIVFQFHFAGPAGVIPILALAILTYLAGISKLRWFQIIAITISVSMLIFYKYMIFLTTEFISLISAEMGIKAANMLKNNILPSSPPLAISFFVFEFVHYLVDVIKGQRPIKSASDFSLFTLFWPTMVAGPIKRYKQFIPSMKTGCSFASEEDLMTGLIKVANGLVKKFTADNLTILIDARVAQFDILPAHYRWLIFIAIGFRILLDFSGYSDMAIGFSRMMGIKVPENFNWPYLASSPIEFWQRWHISLSSWIKDYIYIPLGGGRVSLPRKVANGFLAFALCGLWHGAGYNFLVWGIYHGVGIAFNNFWREKIANTFHLPEYFLLPANILSRILTFLFVLTGWLFFFYPISSAINMIGLLLWGR